MEEEAPDNGVVTLLSSQTIEAINGKKKITKIDTLGIIN